MKNPLVQEKVEKLFISLEGIDKSGKTTQSLHLKNFLKEKGYRVIYTAEPGGTSLGEEIKKILLEGSQREMDKITEMCLYLADRAEHIREVIKPALLRGEIVISDRYADATVAYQGYGRGIKVAWIESLNRKIIGGVFPELTFLLDIDPELASRRGPSTDRMEAENLSFYKRVREGYLKIARSNPERVKIIRAEEKPEEISLRIEKIILKELSRED